MYVKFTSRKRSKLNDVRLRWCSPTAKEQLFLSSSQPQLLSVFPPPPSSPSVMLLWNTLQLEIFMASFPLYVRGAAVVGQGSVSIWWDQMSSTCISTQTPPKAAGFEPDFGKSCSSRLIRDCECHQWLCNVLQVFFLASNSFGMHVNYSSGNINEGLENCSALLLELLNAVLLSSCRWRISYQKYPYS